MSNTINTNVKKVDLSKIATTATDASNQKFIDENKLNKSSFEGTIECKVRDDATVLLLKDGDPLGFTTPESVDLDLPETDNNTIDMDSQSSFDNNTYSPGNPQSSGDYDPSIGKDLRVDNIDVDAGDVNLENSSSVIDQEEVEENTIDDLSKEADAIEDVNKEARAEDFNFKHEESNILAAKARNMGFTDDQIKIAIGISRWETGNYQHLAYGYNYGGVTGNGDLGSVKGYAKYSSADIGMDAYLRNLKDNYFDQGLTTVDSMARRYLGYDNTSKWIKGVKGCMS